MAAGLERPALTHLEIHPAHSQVRCQARSAGGVLVSCSRLPAAVQLVLRLRDVHLEHNRGHCAHRTSGRQQGGQKLAACSSASPASRPGALHALHGSLGMLGSWAAWPGTDFTAAAAAAAACCNLPPPLAPASPCQQDLGKPAEVAITASIEKNFLDKVCLLRSTRADRWEHPPPPLPLSPVKRPPPTCPDSPPGHSKPGAGRHAV